MKKAKKVIGILSVIAVIIYAISAIFMLLQQTADTYVVKQGTISEEGDNAMMMYDGISS